jgi:hypothetical protein
MRKHSKLLILMGVLSLFNMRPAYAEIQSETELKDKNAFQGLAYFNRYEDGGFDWQTLEAGALRIHWYNGDANFGQPLDTAQSGCNPSAC